MLGAYAKEIALQSAREELERARAEYEATVRASAARTAVVKAAFWLEIARQRVESARQAYLAAYADE